MAINCKNLVFGCPRNRNVPEGVDMDLAIPFFKEIGDYAYASGCVIGMEANPTIYNTNYINETKDALDLIKRVNSKGFLLNLDMGTMIQNNENIEILVGNVNKINHVHISEPGLKPIEARDVHNRLKEILEKEGYSRYVSVEMGKVDDIEVVKNVMRYVRSVFA